MFSKKFFLLVLIVLYCVNVGEYLSLGNQDAEKLLKESEKVKINTVLTKISLDQKNGKSVNNRRGRRIASQKTKTKNGKIKLKGKTVLRFQFRWIAIRKRYSLLKRSRKTQNCWLIFPKSHVKIIKFYKISKISFGIIRKVLEHMNRKINSLIQQSNKSIKDKTIFTLLVRGNVEINPGPPIHNPITKNKLSLEIVTFNCNGLGSRQKRVRVLRKASEITKRGGIVMLQETHITKDEQISYNFNQQFISNSYKSNSAGVLTLMGEDFKIIHTDKDQLGRLIIAVVENNEEKFLIANVYCPNDHRQSNTFLENVYTKILEVKNIYPDTYIILGGDFNSCMNQNDYLNRTKSQYEVELTKMIDQNNKLIGIIDAYKYDKCNQDEPGFTWNRGECYSRLDYVYVCNLLASRIIRSSVNWSFERSDHAAVSINVRLRDEIKKGPGTPNVNMEVLKNPIAVESIRQEIIFLLNQIPKDWNGHKKLEYLKVVLRSTIAKFASIEKKDNVRDIETLEESLNDIEMLRQKVLIRLKQNPNEVNKNSISKIDVAKTIISSNLELARNSMTKERDFKSSAKWYEYGEKSNKFFLNLTKFRSKQKLIDRIRDGDRSYVGQSEVINGVREFYQSLYKKRDTNCKVSMEADPTYYNKCPRLSEQDSKKLDEEITVENMLKALSTCKDSAPGPDGIPYSVYKIFWKQVGHILKESWDYSLEIGCSPESHRESTITILPKEGKDHSDIKNWRPITLTNCDAKIITKTLAMRINPILETIIDPSQTAYVPGRSVMDNLRSNKFMKEYCNKSKINAALTSLDAKKAFDSVNHEYIDLTLERYGFGKIFRKYFKTIYKDITARILVNGYFSDSISIERGVKQGDALSCAIFIICIDPLLRNLNGNSKIKGITLKIKLSKKSVCHKASGFADDVSVICSNDDESISQIFQEYQRLTDKADLELNADKTEILTINSQKKVYNIEYGGKIFRVNSVKSLKICGIYTCSDLEEEYKLNVIDKITKFKNKLKLWKSRRLTMEGKSLVLKTFGISQLIYVMQCVEINPEQHKQIERFIFNFLWETKNYDEPRARDRIKRSIMKNDYDRGGLKITDIECLDRSLKLKQYIRAENSKHNMKGLQQFCVENGGGSRVVAQEFVECPNNEKVCSSAQGTINLITSMNRDQMYGFENGDHIDSTFVINQIAAINVETFLTRKGCVFLKCIYNKFKKEGLETFRDLIFAAETELNKNRSKQLESIICAFPKYFREVANSFNDEINTCSDDMTHILTKDSCWLPINSITTKDLQWILKAALGRLDEINWTGNLETIDQEKININLFRKNCKNPKLRNIYFRLIHNDFFTHRRMYKFKMTESPNCPRCNNLETTKHLLWECNDSKKIWDLYNEVLEKSNLQNGKINVYEDIYYTDDTKVLATIKMKIVQELIQIDRPKGWTIALIEKLIVNLRNMEIFNGDGKRNLEQIKNDWIHFMNLS